MDIKKKSFTVHA